MCELDGGQTVSARAVVLATDVDWRRLQAKGEDSLLERGLPCTARAFHVLRAKTENGAAKRFTTKTMQTTMF